VIWTRIESRRGATSLDGCADIAEQIIPLFSVLWSYLFMYF